MTTTTTTLTPQIVATYLERFCAAALKKTNSVKWAQSLIAAMKEDTAPPSEPEHDETQLLNTESYWVSIMIRESTQYLSHHLIGRKFYLGATFHGSAVDEPNDNLEAAIYRMLAMIRIWPKKEYPACPVTWKELAGLFPPQT